MKPYEATIQYATDKLVEALEIATKSEVEAAWAEQQQYSVDLAILPSRRIQHKELAALLKKELKRY